jgi:chemotaxis protein CheX
MKIDFIGSIVLSISNVISTMASIKVVRGKSIKKADNVAHGDVTGIIGMVAPNANGSMAISFSKSAILEIMSGMLGEPFTEINHEVTDCVGEITNMVAGGAKKIMMEKGLDFGMATPVVVCGTNHEIIHQITETKIVIPFNTPEGSFVVEICFQDQ